MMVDFVSQMKTVNLMMSLVQGNLERCTPYPFFPCTEKPMPDRSLYGLETSTPEAQGVESAWLNGFFCALYDCKTIHTHSVAVLRHGKLIAEGSFKPYTAAYPHMQFSLSKSVVGMAVGLAVQEGLLSIEDKLVDFFADDRTLFRSQKLGTVTIKHLLQMTAGVKYNEIFSETDRDWVHGYLSSDCAFEPGTDFYYNSMNSYMLSAVLEKVTGMPLVEYLMPRLFEPLQIPRPRWDVCPMGITKGGWGLYLRTIDMAKLGQLYLQNGRWQCADGPRQIIPEQWVSDSINGMVQTSPNNRDSGYGYQLWRFPVEKAFQYSGVYGQHVIVLPHLDAVVAMTSGSQTFVSDEASEITKKYFARDAEGFHDAPLPSNIRALRKLKETLAHLYAVKETIPPQPPRSALPFFRRDNQEELAPRPVPEFAKPLDGRIYRLENGYGSVMPLALQIFTNNFPPAMNEVTFGFTPGLCHICLRCGEENSTLTAGLENEPFRSNVTYNGETYPVGSSARLTTDEDDRPVLKLYISFLQSPFTRVMKFIFYEDAEKLLVRFDEQPSISESTEMLLSLMGGGSGMQKLFNDEMAQKKLRGRLTEISLPKLHGVRADLRKEQAEMKAEVPAVDTDKSKADLSE